MNFFRNPFKGRGSQIRVLGLFGSSQTLVQGLGMLAGLYIVRVLSTEQYALYTIANSILGAMTLFSDGGIASSVMSQGGRCWRDREKLGIVIATGYRLRQKFSLAAMLFCLPFLIYSLQAHGATILQTGFITSGVLLSFSLALKGTLLTIAPSLHQRLGELARLNLLQSIGRVIALAGCLKLFPYAANAVFAAGIPQFWANRQLRTLAREIADYECGKDPVVRREIVSLVKRTMPGTIYYALSGQITIWLISIFGSTHQLAQVGALGRIGQVLVIFSAIFSAVIVPRFSRLPARSSLILRCFLLIMSILAVMGAIIVCLVGIFPEGALWLLGSKYHALKTEVILTVASSAMGMLAGGAYGLGVSRGIVIPPWISITSGMVCQIALICALNVATVSGVILLSLAMNSVNLIMHGVYVTNRCMADLRSEENGGSRP